LVPMTKIMVIDDDAMVCAAIVQLLTDAGHTVVTAENGRIGFARFRSERPHLVITDLLMPEEEGIQTLRSILSERPDAKVVVVSGSSRAGTNADYLEMARALGAVDAIAKPFDPDEFLHRVSRSLAA
jgi:CheY-like chemotaxis protein